MESTKDKETPGGMENHEHSTDDIPGTTQAPSNDSKQVTASIGDAATPVLLEDCETEGDENSQKPKHSGDVASDPELDELLDCKCSVVCNTVCK